MKKNVLPALLLLLVAFAASAQKAIMSPQGEVIYHVFQRSFYDSNGDRQGDLNGLRAKLGYLQELGITAIMLVPLYDADCYHNYFANNFETIDPEFGTMADYIALVKDIHRHGMKLYLDMETQYVTEKHLWWKDAVGNPQSAYSNYILFDDSAHNVPATMVFDLRQLEGYDGQKIKVTTVNLRSKQVLDYNRQLFGYFLDPNKDGKFDDGADGFRLDHAMDNLDNKPALTGLFANFWKPLLTDLKKINPAIKVVAEQAEWKDYGFDYFAGAGVDRMFGFELRQAILSFNKQQLINKADSTLGLCPKGKEQLVFLENHDIDRFASIETNPQKQRVAAALMMLVGGVPSLYYGQEIGMQGKTGLLGTSDGNGIPVREAFDWYKQGEGEGTAVWYKNTGPWWTETSMKPNDGISLEEETADPNSLFNYYKKLIRLKHSNPALANGEYANAPNDNSKVFSFYRSHRGRKVLVLVNLSGEGQIAVLQQAHQHYTPLWGKQQIQGKTIKLPPYGVEVFEVK
jgi:glycosidase